MRRKYLSEIQLDKVIRLKQAGASWLRIEKMTSIPRRSAKRAYADWERSKSTDELKEARTDVAREEFRKHISHLIAIAESLVSGLGVPTWPTERRDSDEFLRQLWSKEDHTGYPSDERRTLRRNLMLFEALKNHSREKVRWQALEEWGKAWDHCVSVLMRLSQQCEQLLRNILSQMPDLSRKIDRSRIDEASRPALVEGVVAVVWNTVLDGRPEEACGQIKAKELPTKKTVVNFGDRAAMATLTFTDGRMAEEIVKACAWAANNLCKGEDGELILEAQGVVSTMRERREELEDMLDPLILTPLILHTRCEICPV
jgi:hypothetical protein